MHKQLLKIWQAKKLHETVATTLLDSENGVTCLDRKRMCVCYVWNFGLSLEHVPQTIQFRIPSCATSLHKRHSPAASYGAINLFAEKTF